MRFPKDVFDRFDAPFVTLAKDVSAQREERTVVLRFRAEKELRAYGWMLDPDDPGKAIRLEDTSRRPAADAMTPARPAGVPGGDGAAATRKRLEECLVDTLGDGDHSLQVATPGPTLVMVRDYGFDEAGGRAWDVHVLDPGSENQLPLAAVVDHVAWLRRFKARGRGATRTVADIEREILALHRGLNFRHLLATCARIGSLLLELKRRVRHGQWEMHLRAFGKRGGIKLRELQIYMQCAKAQHAALLREHVSIRGFLSAIKNSKRAARAQERQEAREAVMASATPDERYRLVHADCRTFGWPDQLDLIATDPPWKDMESYRWLARFAMHKLKDGGTLFVQCDTEMVAQVCRIIEDAGLTYVTALAITFDECHPLRHHPLNLGWRPVLLFAKGSWNYKGLARRLDRHQAERAYKTLHEWQQPIRPWEYWLTGLTRAGEVVGDPFACTGTVGVAAKAAGGRYYIGTEIDADNALVGQGRLARQREGVRTVTEGN
jgi:hypothetical protein